MTHIISSETTETIDDFHQAQMILKLDIDISIPGRGATASAVGLIAAKSGKQVCAGMCLQRQVVLGLSTCSPDGSSKCLLCCKAVLEIIKENQCFVRVQ